MATLTISKNYADSTVLFESDLDDFKNDLETFFNTTKFNDDNLQDAGITASEKFANNSVTGDLFDAGVVDNVTVELVTNKLQLKDIGISTPKLIDGAVTGVKMNDDIVTVDKIAATTVTRDKQEIRTVTINSSDPGAGGISKSASTGSATITSVLFVNVASTVLTTTGRPVMIFLEPDGTSFSAFGADTTTEITTWEVEIRRGSTTIWTTLFNADNVGAVVWDYRVSCANIFTTDTPSAGTHTFQVRARRVTAVTTVFVQNLRIVALEI